MKSKFTGALLFSLLFMFNTTTAQEHSIARQWNELLLESIRNDFARPTVHARNLFHTSIAMYDAWAVYDTLDAEPYLLGQTVGNFSCSLDSFPMPSDLEAARIEAISYAAYRIMRHRFQFSLPVQDVLPEYDFLMAELGYNPFFTSTDYTTGSPAALGNYIAQCIIQYGLQDRSNEQFFYDNQFYEPINLPLVVDETGNETMFNPNRWQPLTLENNIDQSGNPIPGSTLDFLSPEWGLVHPFSLTEDDLTVYERDGNEYWVYHDPGPPPYMGTSEGEDMTEEYQWGFSLVSLWSSHLDPTDGVMIDISPASIGNIAEEDYPTTIEGLRDFYNTLEGGDPGTGHDLNPVTGNPYEPQIVPRADYARVLAEFWADGPDSETPPGHWFTILNYVNDHELLEKRYRGIGEVIDDLEWDIKAYLMLGGAMHDCAISAWGIKGWYDYTRPVSAIRYMYERGQSTDMTLPNYHPRGLPLVPGYIEVVEEGDPLTFADPSNLGKIKVKAWRGPDYIFNPENTYAGVGWILAGDWFPYQRPSFVTPPFAGYVSGHSTYSRAAAEVLTMLTGDPFFPGGVGEFHAPRNEFLVFEDGPSVDVILQWATYRDASDQTSLSRIWGGIHPPADDIPGRLIGEKIGISAFTKAESYFYADEDGDGYTAYIDCNDNNPAIHPGAPETCNGLDNDCNGLVEDGLESYLYYMDEDNDRFGNPAMVLDTCLSQAPAGFTTNSTDCDDNDPTVNADEPEIPNNDIDEDCDGVALIIDQDEDGFNSDEDCDDNDSTINPDAVEIPNNNVDEDCDGIALMIDNDEDGFNSDEDCDDDNPAINPDAEEIANNGIDEDCDGMDLVSSSTEIDGQALTLFPNPARDFLVVELEQALPLVITIYDLTGRNLYEQSFSDLQYRIDVSAFENGIYFIKMWSAQSNEVLVQKLEIF